MLAFDVSKTGLSLHFVGHFGTFFDVRAKEPGVCIPAIVGHLPSDTIVIFLDSRLALAYSMHSFKYEIPSDPHTGAITKSHHSVSADRMQNFPGFCVRQKYNNRFQIIF